MAVAACEAEASFASLMDGELFVYHHAPAPAINSVAAAAASIDLEVFLLDSKATAAVWGRLMGRLLVQKVSLKWRVQAEQRRFRWHRASSRRCETRQQTVAVPRVELPILNPQRPKCDY